MTSNIIPNWKISTPDPLILSENYVIQLKLKWSLEDTCLVMHGGNIIQEKEQYGVLMPDGMKENDKFPHPIITPTTKASVGHDEDISREEIISQGLVSERDYNYLEEKTLALFDAGTEYARNKGLILVDTKYEFGKDKNGEILLIDEIHTPDSSRYFYLSGCKRQEKGEKQKQLSKEFVRQWN